MKKLCWMIKYNISWKNRCYEWLDVTRSRSEAIKSPRRVSWAAQMKEETARSGNGGNQVNPIIPIVMIETTDIQEDVELWSSAVVCYVLGANPPLSVMEGYCRRI